jgi:hypothetical protein
MDDLLHKELLKWKKAGVVEATTSAFSSPIFLLKKPVPPNAPKDYKVQYRPVVRHEESQSPGTTNILWITNRRARYP